MIINLFSFRLDDRVIWLVNREKCSINANVSVDSVSYTLIIHYDIKRVKDHGSTDE